MLPICSSHHLGSATRARMGRAGGRGGCIIRRRADDRWRPRRQFPRSASGGVLRSKVGFAHAAWSDARWPRELPRRRRGGRESRAAGCADRRHSARTPARRSHHHRQARRRVPAARAAALSRDDAQNGRGDEGRCRKPAACGRPPATGAAAASPAGRATALAPPARRLCGEQRASNRRVCFGDTRGCC